VTDTGFSQRDTDRRARTRSYLLHVVALPVLALAVHLALSWSYYVGPQVERGDLALAAIQIERAAHFQESLGPYSRFGFNHPGPVSFYYFAAVEPLFPFVPTPMGRQLLAQLLLNFAFLIIAVHTLCVAGRHRRECLLLFGAFAFVFIRSDVGPAPLSHVWSPFLVIFPMLALLTTGSAVAIGRLASLLPATLATIVIVHNHLSGILVAGPILFGALVSCAWRRRSTALSRGERWHVALSVAALVATSSPPVLEQLIHPAGNFSKIAAYAAAHGGQQHPWRIAGHFIAGYFKAPLAFLRVNGEFWAALMLVAGAVVWRRGAAFERALAAGFVAGLLLSIGVATRVMDTLYGYLFLFDIAVVSIGLFLVLVAAGGTRKWVAWAIAAAGLVVLVAHPVRALAPDPYIDQMVAFLRPDSTTWYRLSWPAGRDHQHQWAPVAGVALRLQRAGAQPCLSAEWAVPFGHEIPACPDGGRVERVVFYETSAHGEQVRERVGTFGTTTLETGAPIARRLPVAFVPESADGYFDGWTATVERTRWLVGDRGDVQFVLAESGESGQASELVLVVTARGDRGQRVQVTVNGTDVGAVSVEGGRPRNTDLRVPIALLRVAPQPNTIAFARTPARVGEARGAFGVDVIVPAAR
jgi:hypothetical protein